MHRGVTYQCTEHMKLGNGVLKTTMLHVVKILS